MRRAVVFVLLAAACGRSGFEQTSTVVGPDAPVNAASDAAVDAAIDGPPPPWAALAPVGYYPFDGDATDAAYAPGAFACASCTFVAGRRGMAVRATNEALPDRPGGAAGYTLAAWIYVPSVFPGNYAGCLTLGGAAGGIESDDEPARVMIFGGGYTPASTSLIAVTGDAWNHVAMTYVAASGMTTLFIDATARGSVTATTADGLDFARVAGATCLVAVDDLFLFDRVLSASELATVRDL